MHGLPQYPVNDAHVYHIEINKRHDPFSINILATTFKTSQYTSLVAAYYLEMSSRDNVGISQI